MINTHYKNRYDKFIKIIEKSNRTFKEDEYTETHHIIPRCLKGTDNEDNLIELSLREHFLAHWLLWKAYPNYLPLASAFLQMNNKNPKIKDFQGRITSRAYEVLKTEVYNNLKEYTTDKVRIRDENGELITMTKQEYANQTKYKFHTSGKVYVLDTLSDQWVYITSEEYHLNKERYITRLSKQNFQHKRTGNINPTHIPNVLYRFLDTDTNTIVKLTKSEASDSNKFLGYKKYKQIISHRILCVDEEGNSKTVPLIEYQNSNNLTHVNKGKVVVYDLNEGTTKSIVKEEYNLNRNRYLTSTKNKVLVKDDSGNSILIDKKDFKKGNYVGHTKGFRTVFDSQTQTYTQVDEKEFSQNRHRYAGPNIGKINVINKITGIRLQIPKNMFDQNIHLSLGSTNYLFKCRNKLTGKEKNINIYEWDLVKNEYKIIDLEKYNKAKLLK